jgi:hypothetical protein
MTPFEINVAVAEKLGMIVQTGEHPIGMSASFHEQYPHTVWCAPALDEVQYEPWEQKCWTHSWEDLGPVMEGNKIQTRYSETYKQWVATWSDMSNNYSVRHESCKIAICLVLLKIK